MILRARSSRAHRSARPLLSGLVVWIASTTLPLLFVFAWSLVYPLSTRLLAGCVAASLGWTGFVAWLVRKRLAKHFRTLGNMVESTRVQDYSVRAVHAREPGPLGELYRQVNALIADLDDRRSTEEELLGILRKVVDQIGVAILVFDAAERLRLVNPLGFKLLGLAAKSEHGIAYADTPFAHMELSAEPGLFDCRFAGGDGRWQISSQSYRQRGRPARIVFVADVGQVLADEEIRVWQRLIRVVSHEVNNSLAPIASLCQTLDGILARASEQAHVPVVRDGLALIAERASGLKDFISVYARIARLPEAKKTLFPVGRLVRRVMGMFAADGAGIMGEIPDLEIFGDEVHLEQVLINLLRNAVQATGGAAGMVTLSVRVHGDSCEFEIADRGPGIANPGNLFVPFYTTKPDGAGIGLVLCRNILAKHAGKVTLTNRDDGHGAVARVALPLPPTK